MFSDSRLSCSPAYQAGPVSWESHHAHGAIGRQESSAEARYNLGYIWTISLVAALGGLLFGYDWVVISGAKMSTRSNSI